MPLANEWERSRFSFLLLVVMLWVPNGSTAFVMDHTKQQWSAMFQCFVLFSRRHLPWCSFAGNAIALGQPVPRPASRAGLGVPRPPGAALALALPYPVCRPAFPSVAGRGWPRESNGALRFVPPVVQVESWVLCLFLHWNGAAAHRQKAAKTEIACGVCKS